MNVDRPVLPWFSLLFLMAIWSGMAIMACAVIYALSHAKRRLAKLLITVGCVGVFVFPTSIIFKEVLACWYGGDPDAAASSSGHYFVVERGRHTPVTAQEFGWRVGLRENNSWWLAPFLFGCACTALGLLAQPPLRDERDSASA